MPTPTDRRIELQNKLVEVLGSNRVYYRPPENIKLSYPCIVYNLRSGDAIYANNQTYKFTRSYDVQLIHKTADTDLIERLMFSFPHIRFENSFTFDNLIHENFVINY